jgi:hypothetical protein
MEGPVLKVVRFRLVLGADVERFLRLNGVMQHAISPTLPGLWRRRLVRIGPREWMAIKLYADQYCAEHSIAGDRSNTTARMALLINWDRAQIEYREMAFDGRGRASFTGRRRVS